MKGWKFVPDLWNLSLWRRTWLPLQQTIAILPCRYSTYRHRPAFPNQSVWAAEICFLTAPPNAFRAEIHRKGGFLAVFLRLMAAAWLTPLMVNDNWNTGVRILRLQTIFLSGIWLSRSPAAPFHCLNVNSDAAPLFSFAVFFFYLGTDRHPAFSSPVQVNYTLMYSWSARNLGVFFPPLCWIAIKLQYCWSYGMIIKQ